MVQCVLLLHVAVLQMVVDFFLCLLHHLGIQRSLARSVSYIVGVRLTVVLFSSQVRITFFLQGLALFVSESDVVLFCFHYVALIMLACMRAQVKKNCTFLRCTLGSVACAITTL